MLHTFFEIMLAFFAVYGGYCLTVNIFYHIFCGKNDKIRLAYVADDKNNNFSEIFFAKKAFLGRSRVIILVDCNLGEDCLSEINEDLSGADVYIAERITKNERRTQYK